MKTKTYLTLIAAACLLGVASSAKAATYSWNGSTTGGATGSSNIWDTNTTANWTGAGTLWPASGTDNDAVFGGTAGTVTIAAGGVTANDITFNTTGYTLTGGNLTLNGTTPTLTIGSGSATISSNIAGSAGLTKSGSGTVTLSAPVYSYTGATSITGGTLVIDASAATANGFFASSGFAISGGATLQLQTTNVSAVRWGSGQITGAGTFQRTGSGSIYFGNPATSFNQSAGGLADFQGGTSLYVQTQTTNLGGLTVNNATITLSGAEYFDALNGNGTINSQDAGALVVGQNNGGGTFSGTINGIGASSRSLTKNGNGTQTLSGANTYTGNTTVNAGELDLVVGAATANASTYYTGAMIVNGGKLVLDASSTPQSNTFFNASGYAIASGATMELRTGTTGSYNWSSVTSQITGAGTFLRTGSNTINFANPAVSLNQSAGGLADFEGGISNYVKTQTTNLGGLTINNATVGGFGDVYFDALNGNGTLTSMDAGTFNIGVNGGSGTFTGTISNAGTRALTKSGTGTQTLSGANTYTGVTTVSAGALVAGTNSAVSTNGAFGNASSAIILGDANTTTNNSSPSLLIGGAFNVGRDITIANQTTSGTYTIGGNTADSSTFSGAIALNKNLTITAVTGGTVNLTKSISNASGTNTVSITGAGTSNIVLNNASANQFAPTLFSVASGKLSLGASDQIANATNLAVGGGTFNIGTFSDTVGGVQLTSGSITGNGTLTSTSTFDVQSGSVSANLAGSVGLTKSGNGTQTLSGANTYTGTTTVTAGTLLVNGSTSSSSAVNVSSGATLGGSGTVAGVVTVTGGTISPGNSPGILTVGSLSLDSSSTTHFEINGIATAGTDYDRVVVNTASGLTLNGAFTIAFGNGTALANTTNINLFQYTGLHTGDFTSLVSTGFYTSAGWTHVGEAFTFNTGPQLLTFSEITGNLTVVPEPATWGLLVFSLTTVMVLRRRPQFLTIWGESHAAGGDRRGGA